MVLAFQKSLSVELVNLSSFAEIPCHLSQGSLKIHSVVYDYLRPVLRITLYQSPEANFDKLEVI
jgi:hypothetical protein